MITEIIEIKAEPGKEICDFCSSPDVRWQYPADDGIIKGSFPQNVIRESIGDWSACGVCSELIESDFKYALMERSVESNLKSCPGYTLAVMDFICDEVCKVHKVFWEKRKGPRIKIERGT